MAPLILRTRPILWLSVRCMAEACGGGGALIHLERKGGDIQSSRTAIDDAATKKLMGLFRRLKVT
jgi:hypothetical protein